MERLSTFNVWQVEGAGRILPHLSNIFGLRADDLVDEQSLLWMRVDLRGNGDDANFRLWLQADIQPPEIDFRSTPESRHSHGHH